MEDVPQVEYTACTPGTRHQTPDHEDLWSLSHYKLESTEVNLLTTLPLATAM